MWRVREEDSHEEGERKGLATQREQLGREVEAEKDMESEVKR